MPEPQAFTFHEMALLQTELQLNDLHLNIHTLLKQKADINGKLERQQKEEVKLVQKATHFKKIMHQTNAISDYLPNRYGLLSCTPTKFLLSSSSVGTVTLLVNVTTPVLMVVTPASNVTTPVSLVITVTLNVATPMATVVTPTSNEATPLSIVATSASNVTTNVYVVATADLMLTNAVASVKRKLNFDCEGSKPLLSNSSATSGMPGCSGVSYPDVDMMEDRYYVC